jgi:hypothetical protein
MKNLLSGFIAAVLVLFVLGFSAVRIYLDYRIGHAWTRTDWLLAMGAGAMSLLVWLVFSRLAKSSRTPR